MAARIFVVHDDRYVLALMVGELFNAGYEVVLFDDPMFAVRALDAPERDDTSWLRPTTHYWTRSKQRWVVLSEDATQMMTQPNRE